MEQAAVKEQWHLSKSVPVSILLALVLQAGAFVWTISSMQGNVDRNTQDIKRVAEEVKTIQVSSSEQAQQLARIEERLLGVQTSIDRLIRNLESR